jgi:hypothetical protein
MPTLDEETIKELKSQKIADLLEEILTNAALDVLSRLAQRQKLPPSTTCYKTDCPARDEIPF